MPPVLLNTERRFPPGVPRNLPQQLIRQPLHAGLLVPSIGHFANVDGILTQTIFRPSISLFQTKTLETSTKTRMQTSWQACWPEKELGLYAV